MITLSTRAKEAIKTGLAMVIAYWIPLQMGWEDPFWPALTVVTINMMTTGQSLPRSILRSSGTLVGGVAALALLGLFPQQRFWFMIALSLFVGFSAYMMKGKKYQYFWFLAALTCLLIPFKSLPLDSNTAFQAAVMRTVETATGALVWILVAAFIWPRSSLGAFNDVTRKLWDTQIRLYRTYRELLSGKGIAEESRPLRLEEVQFLTQFGPSLDAAEADSYEVWEVRHHWGRFHQQSTALMEALERWRQSFAEIQPLTLTRLLPNLEGICAELDLRFEQIQCMLANEAPTRTPQAISLAVDKSEMRAVTRFEEAAVVVTQTQLENLERLSRSLFDCVADIRGYTQTGAPAPSITRRSRLAIDPDRFRAATGVVTALWVAFFIWVYIDPPTDSGFVMMAAIFALIMQLAPQGSPALQYMAWGLGAGFAGVLYVFVMPHLSGYSELALLIFGANFAMYYLFGEPRQTLARMLCMASFSILLFVDNQQTYSFAQYANTLAGLIILPLSVAVATRYVPTSPRPEKTFLRLLRRFFRQSESLTARMALDWKKKRGFLGRWQALRYRNNLLELPEKLAACGQQIDYGLMPDNTPDQVQALATSMGSLAFRMKDLVDARADTQADLFVRELLADETVWRVAIEKLYEGWAKNPAVQLDGDVREQLAARLGKREEHINQTLGMAEQGELSDDDLKNFYRLLGSYRGVSEAVVTYALLAKGINWELWEEARF